jgi:hypothetical protein
MPALLRRVILMLLVVIICYMSQISQSKVPGIQIVSSGEIDTAIDDASSRLAGDPGKHERWEQLHETLESVLGEYGSVSWDPDPLPDFYFSGDWFHENSDGFSICSSKAVSKELLLRLWGVLGAHHKDAMLGMYGIEDPIEGLVIHATAKEVLVGWQDLTADQCKQRLHEVGISLD